MQAIADAHIRRYTYSEMRIFGGAHIRRCVCSEVHLLGFLVFAFPPKKKGGGEKRTGRFLHAPSVTLMLPVDALPATE